MWGVYGYGHLREGLPKNIQYCEKYLVIYVEIYLVFRFDSCTKINIRCVGVGVKCDSMFGFFVYRDPKFFMM